MNFVLFSDKCIFSSVQECMIRTTHSWTIQFYCRFGSLFPFLQSSTYYQQLFIIFQEACIDYICDNISSICNSVTTECGDQKLQFKEEEIFFHTELSEQLLVRLCEKKKLDDLVLTLFQVREGVLYIYRNFNYLFFIRARLRG